MNEDLFSLGPRCGAWNSVLKIKPNKTGRFNWLNLELFFIRVRLFLWIDSGFVPVKCG